MAARGSLLSSSQQRGLHHSGCSRCPGPHLSGPDPETDLPPRRMRSTVIGDVYVNPQLAGLSDMKAECRITRRLKEVILQCWGNGAVRAQFCRHIW